jgi:signal recognition particle subunit SRP54
MGLLGSLGESLYNTIKKFLGSPIADEKAVKELLKGIQRALLQADVNVNLVLNLSKNIEERVFKEKIPPGISRKDYVLKIVYDELVNLMGGENPVKIEVKPIKPWVIMLVGIQGSGKTTSAVKIARFLNKRGSKVALVCADTYRPAAYQQLKQLADMAGIPVYGDLNSKDPIKVANDGVCKFRNEKYDYIIVDTAGRHKEEKGLMEEMKNMAKAINPDEIILVIDGTIGQQAMTQALAFNQATSIGSIFITKLDGAARGGGALSAAAATNAKIKFIGLGEKIDEIELFNPRKFVERLLGMGDLQALIEKVKEGLEESVEKQVSIERLSLNDMLKQLQALKKMGPLDKIISLIPGVSYQLPKEIRDMTEDKINKWIVIMQSMTKEELENPSIISGSRIRRIAFGAGVSTKDVKDLLDQYFKMKKLMRQFMRRRKLFEMIRTK